MEVPAGDALIQQQRSSWICTRGNRAALPSQRFARIGRSSMRYTGSATPWLGHNLCHGDGNGDNPSCTVCGSQLSRMEVVVLHHDRQVAGGTRFPQDIGRDPGCCADRADRPLDTASPGQDGGIVRLPDEEQRREEHKKGT
jgi:hypothetical protein